MLQPTRYKQNSYTIEKFLSLVKTDKYIIYENSFREGYTTSVTFVDDYMEIVSMVIKNSVLDEHEIDSATITYNSTQSYTEIKIGIFGGRTVEIDLYIIFNVSKKQHDKIYSKLSEKVELHNASASEEEDWSWATQKK